MSRLSCVFGVAAAVMLTAPLVQSEPAINCGILSSDATTVVDGISHLSNLKRIVVQVAVLLDQQRTLVDPLRVVPDSVGLANLALRITRKTDNVNVTSATTIDLQASGVRGRALFGTVMLDIPIDESVREGAIADFVTRVTNSAVLAGSTTSPAAEVLQQRPGDAGAYLRTLFVENRPGPYEVTCVYNPRLALNATPVLSKPVPIEIDFDGHFFDQSAFALR